MKEHLSSTQQNKQIQTESLAEEFKDLEAYLD